MFARHFSPRLVCTLAIALVATATVCLAADDARQYSALPQSKSAAHLSRIGHAGLVPIRPTDANAITVDGNLDDWSDMTTDAVAIHQLLDHTVPDFHQSWKQAWTDQPLDAALIKLRRSDDALYLAIKVADRDIITPVDDKFVGDAVDIYFDLRPLTGNGPTVGHVKWTTGVYQLVVGPTQAGRKMHVLQPEGQVFDNWGEGRPVPRLGKIDAAGALFEGGYTIEMRLPLSSFPHDMPADRLEQPFGFEVMICDRDTKRPAGQPERMYYSCSGYDGGSNYFKSLAVTARTDEVLRTRLPLARMKPNSLANAPGGHEGEGWIIAALDDDTPRTNARLWAQPDLPSQDVNRDFAAHGLVTYPCEALGIAFHHRNVLHRLPASAPAAVGNRYLAVWPKSSDIKIDGKLDDWSGFTRRAMSLHQRGMIVWCAAASDRTDSARVQMQTANDHLYVAVHVRDDSVVHPGGKAAPAEGDCVQLFLDVREPHADANPMSSGQYSDGVYHLIIAPPAGTRDFSLQAQGKQVTRPAKAVASVARRTDDGYIVEAQIPLEGLLDNAPAGRFEKPFGLEVLVTDVDGRVDRDNPLPRISYGWGSSTERQFAANPAHFNCADYVPNRLPEIRALVDDSPVSITIKDTPQQKLIGLGGNIPRDGALTHTGGRASRYAITAASTNYVVNGINFRCARVNLHLFPWEWANDNNAPDKADLSRFQLAPGEDAHHNPGPHYKTQVDAYLKLLAGYVSGKANRNAMLIAHVANWPAWLMPKEANGTIPRELWPELAECIATYMLYARDEFGITFDAYAFRNAHWGTPRFEADDYVDLLKYLGTQFKARGLETKLLLCDTDAMHDWRWYAPMTADADLLDHIVGIGIETEGPLTPHMTTWRLWRDLARHADRPLIMSSFGRPYTSSPTYLFDEVAVWHDMLGGVGASAGAIRQFVSEKSNKWLMVHGRDITAPPREGLPPRLQTAFIADDPAAVLPTLRFGITRQFCELTPPGRVMETRCLHPQVRATAVQGEDGAFVLHISNAGAARTASVTDLPAHVKELHVTQTGDGKLCDPAAPVTPERGTVSLDLPAWSVVTLTTRK